MNRGAAATVETSLPRPRLGFAGGSLLLFVLLAAISWAYILLGEKSGIANLFSRDAWAGATKFIERMVGTGSESVPAYLSPESWLEAAGLAYETAAMSVLAMGLVGVMALLTFMPAARNVAFGELAPSRSPVWRALFFIVKGVYIFTRGIPELLWAMLILFFFSPGILPGALALGIHNFGIVGKLSAEVVEDLDTRPARALRSAGAGPFQMLAYGILPQALPSFLTYLLYRWEVIIRTTIVVGFVGAGGLGREFRLSMSWFHYTDITLLLMVYLIMVLAVDLLSTWMRKLAR
ncbi:MAG: phosphonate transporter permease protein [Dehalococcoidia bacterium]|nr:phosphonate transporter permease protein [Dehalococcoidia bacterium]